MFSPRGQFLRQQKSDDIQKKNVITGLRSM